MPNSADDPVTNRISILESSIKGIALDVSNLSRIVHQLTKAISIANPGMGEIKPKDGGRVELKGSCDKKDTLISQTNDRGTTETIRYITNIGSCGNVTIRCLDSLNRELSGTAVVLGPGQTIRSYTSETGPFKIVFSCDGNDGDCKIEFDR